MLLNHGKSLLIQVAEAAFGKDVFVQLQQVNAGDLRV